MSETPSDAEIAENNAIPDAEEAHYNAVMAELREMALMSDQQLKDVSELRFRRAILNTIR